MIETKQLYAGLRAKVSDLQETIDELRRQRDDGFIVIIHTSLDGVITRSVEYRCDTAKEAMWLCVAAGKAEDAVKCSAFSHNAGGKLTLEELEGMVE